MKNLTTLEVNKIIVYVTFTVLVLSAFSCIIIFALRIRKTQELTHERDIEEEVSFLEPPVMKSNSSKGSMQKSKKAKSRSDTEHGTDETANSFDSSSRASSENTSFLHGSQIDNKAQLHNNTMDRALRASFHAVLADGLTLTMHSDQTPVTVKMSLKGSELRWRSKKMFSSKSYTLPLCNIVLVEGGKQFSTFQRASAKATNEETCFSLVTDSVTYDFETSSKVERDALVQGFALSIADLHKRLNTV